MSKKLTVAVDNKQYDFVVDHTTTVLDLKYQISQQCYCDIIMIDVWCNSYAAKNYQVVDVKNKYTANIASDYRKNERLWQPHWGQVYLTKQDCQVLSKKYNYERESLKLKLTFSFWCGDYIWHSNIDFKDPITVDPFLTFGKFEKKMTEILIERKICTEEDIKRTYKYSGEKNLSHIYYNANIKSSGYLDNCKTRALDTTFETSTNGVYAYSHPRSSPRSDYEDVPICNRFKSGDLVQLSWCILSPNLIKVNISATNSTYLKSVERKFQLSSVASSALYVPDKRQLIVEVIKKSTGERKAIPIEERSGLAEKFLDDDDTLVLTALETIPIKLLTDQEIQYKVRDLTRGLCYLFQKSRHEHLYQHRDFFYDLDIVITDGKESRSHKMLLTMMLLKSNDDGSFFSLWFKNREKEFADIKMGEIKIDVSESPFDQFDYECNDLCLKTMIAYSYGQADIRIFDNKKMDQFVQLLYCLAAWAEYFGLDICPTFKNCLNSDFCKECVARCELSASTIPKEITT